MAVAGRGVGLLGDENIPNGIFLMEKWLSLDTGIYDMKVLGRKRENYLRMVAERQESANEGRIYYQSGERGTRDVHKTAIQLGLLLNP